MYLGRWRPECSTSLTIAGLAAGAGGGVNITSWWLSEMNTSNKALGTGMTTIPDALVNGSAISNSGQAIQGAQEE